MNKDVRNIDLSGVVITNNKCQGSNRCMRACDYFGTNTAVLNADGRYSFVVDNQKCISCGACITACKNGARDFVDDTYDFFEALKNDEEISVIVSPLFRLHYPEEYRKVLGGLKKLGVKNFFGESVGFDISTWAYIAYMKQNNTKFMIAQHCASVVNYIVRFLPELREHLSPVQSPIMCTAIYAKNELKINHKFAYIGSCIGKRTEFESYRGDNHISYNLTFKHLMNYVRDNNIMGDVFVEEIDESLNFANSIKDALSENLRFYLGEEVLTRNISGVYNVHDYLNHNKDKILENKLPYTILELVNCSEGCIYGTGIENHANHNDDALIRVMNIKKEKKDSVFHKSSPTEALNLLNDKYKDLNIEDYLCEYLDVSYAVNHEIPNTQEIELIYDSLGKNGDRHKNLNCACCGYNSCLEMVYAIHNGYNTPQKCIHFVKEEVLKERDKAIKADMYKELAIKDSLTGLLNRNAFNDWAEITTDYSKCGIITFDLNDLKVCNDTYGHIAGDTYIKLSAQMIKECFGKFGSSYRIGGDEFCTVLTNNTEDELKEAIKDFDKLQNDYNEAKNYEFKIVIPYGYAFFNKNLDKVISDTRKRADDHLYINKAKLKREKTYGKNGIKAIYLEEFAKNIEF